MPKPKFLIYGYLSRDPRSNKDIDLHTHKPQLNIFGDYYELSDEAPKDASSLTSADDFFQIPDDFIKPGEIKKMKVTLEVYDEQE